MFQKYGKSIVSFLLAVGYLVYQQFTGDKHIDGVELALIVAGFGNAALTFIVPLVPEYRWAKTAASAIAAAGTALMAVSLGGYTNDELVTVLLAVAQFLGVTLAPAISDNGVEAKAGLTDA